MPRTILDLIHLEGVFDVLDLYLWLRYNKINRYIFNFLLCFYIYFIILYSYFFSYRFMDLFPDGEMVRDVQKELDALIEAGIVRLTNLLLNSEAGK